MTQTRGWSPSGTPLMAKVPHGHWKALIFLAGLLEDRIVAPCVIDGPISGVSFATWGSQSLPPTRSRGDIVIADNLGSHKGKPVRDALRAVGAKLKPLPRKADERSVEASWYLELTSASGSGGRC